MGWSDRKKSTRVPLARVHDGLVPFWPMPTSPLQVLIVDDDRSIAAMLMQMIREMADELLGEPVWADRGAAARKELKERRFQLVLLDYLLPDEDGLALLSVINKLPAAERPVVIMLTGAGSEKVAVEAMKLGARDYIVKTGLNFRALHRSIVVALEHRRLEEKLAQSTVELRRRNVEMEADLVLARSLQKALLPQTYPVFPACAPAGEAALRFFHRWIPSAKVGGDLFDVFPVGKESAGIFLYDVMGHGVRAALVTALLRGVAREQLHLADRPAMFLGAINHAMQTLLGQADDLVFATAVYAVVNASNGKTILANAGHPGPLHLRRRLGQAVPLLRSEGPDPALGLIPDSIYDESETTLEPNDALLLFTDGLFEAADAEGGEFGYTRLRAAVNSRLARPTPLLIEELLTEIKSFQGNGKKGFADDVCLMAVDRAPVAQG